MPVHAIDWNPDDLTLAIIHARKCTIRKAGNRIFIDQTPTFDRLTKPWGVTPGDEQQVGQLTGNLSDAEKLAQVIAWVNEFCFMFITLLTDLHPEHGDRLADPNHPNKWWSDEHGVPDAAGTHLTVQYIELIDFDAVELLTNDVLIATIRKVF